MLKLTSFLFISALSLGLLVATEFSGELAIAAHGKAETRSAIGSSEALPRLAQRGKKRSNKRSGVRKRNLIQEKKYRGRSKNVDFDAIDITGQRENPLGSALINKQANKEFDLIQIRRDWKPEMVQSTSSLETGRGRK